MKQIKFLDFFFNYKNVQQDFGRGKFNYVGRKERGGGKFFFNITLQNSQCYIAVV